jgi:hypothetical protein
MNLGRKFLEVVGLIEPEEEESCSSTSGADKLRDAAEVAESSIRRADYTTMRTLQRVASWDEMFERDGKRRG